MNGRRGGVGEVVDEEVNGGRLLAGDAGKRVVDMARMNVGRGLGKRGIMSAAKGRILFQGPSKTTWADTIELDGVRYTAETPQSQVFISADGKVLNYTQPAT